MSLNALVVTVTEDTRDERRRLLERAGFTVFIAVDFHAGCELVRELRPDLLVADVRLMEFNGLHLAFRAGAESPGTRVLIVGDPEVVLEAEARAMGAWYMSSCELAALLEALRYEPEASILHLRH
jgi:DNA-binding response OmpR family regulator